MSRPHGVAVVLSVLALCAGLAGCATDGNDQLTSGSSSAYAVSPSSSPPAVTFSYKPGPVAASVDDAEVTLRPFGFSRGADITNAPIVQAGDGCNGEAFGSSTGSVVVVEPGGCSLDSKYANSVKAGASGLLVAEVAPLDEQVGQWSSPPLTMTSIPVLFSTSPDSAEELKKGGAVSIQFAASVGQSEN